MTDRELMQQALDALEVEHSAIYGTSQTAKAIEALRARLAQPEPEPVAWVAYENGEKHGIDFDEDEIAKLPVGTMLYTAPPQQPEPEQEIDPDRDHVEDDGCPTEKAVLQRFWREHQKQEPVATLFGSLPVYDVPSKQEPVAWMHNFIDEVVIAHRPADLDRHPDRWTALYKDPTPCQTCEALARTVMMDQVSYDIPPRHREPPTQDLSAPLTVNGVPMYPQREWQGLTRDEVSQIWSIIESEGDVMHEVQKFARAIEAKLKEKNT